MRRFAMIREFDESGVSGTGRILEGVIWSDCTVSVRWMTVTASFGNYDSFEDFEAIHISSHPKNKTRLVWES